MEREVSVSIQMAAIIMLLSALLGVVWFTVQVGRDTEDMAIERASDMSDSIKVDYIDEMTNKNTILPAAAAYEFIEKNQSLIVSIEYNIKYIDPSTGAYEIIAAESFDNAGKALSRHLAGKVSLQVTKKSAEQYMIVIHKANCTWDTATCTD